MPKRDENKLADILNTLLTDNIKTGESLIEKMTQSVDSFNKSVECFSNNINSRTSEVKEFIAALKSAPKISKTLKLSSLVSSFAVGAALAAMFFSYSISTITYNYIESNLAHRELMKKYDELERYALSLDNQNEAFKNTLVKTLTQNGVEKFNELFSEELQKIKEQQ